MTNFLMDATELQIFDESGKLITEITENTKTYLSMKGDNSTFSIENITLDLDLLKSFADSNGEEELTDFESKLSQGKTKIKFKKFGVYDKKFKIISKGILYDAQTEKKSHHFNIVLHNLLLDSPIEIDAQSGQLFYPSYTFKIENDEFHNFVDLELIEVK